MYQESHNKERSTKNLSDAVLICRPSTCKSGNAQQHDYCSVVLRTCQKVSVRCIPGAPPIIPQQFLMLRLVDVFTFIFSCRLLSSPIFFSLPLRRNSDPGLHSRLFSPPEPLRFVPCIVIARRFQLFLPSSTRVELCLPTLGALSNC